MFDTKYFKTLNEFKFIGDFKKILSPILNTFLSLAGVPPLMGFCSKFIIFIVVFEKINFTFILLYSFFNLFVIYFYIQNFRFLSSNKTYIYFLKIPQISKNFFLFVLLSLFQFFNFFFILFFEEFLIYINFFSIFVIF